MLYRGFLLSVAFLSAWAIGATAASALTITLSDVTSEPTTNPAGDLFADISFQVSNCTASSCTLTVTLANRTNENTSGVTYRINEIGFNATFATFNSPDLSLVSATKIRTNNTTQNVTSHWNLFEQVAVDDINTHLDGFGVFDFALIDGVGNQPGLAHPGESIVFVLTAPAGITEDDFLSLSHQTTGGDNILASAAAKFVSGAGPLPSTCGPSGTSLCDSAFGATTVFVPEPTVAAALGIAGLALVAWRTGRRGRRRP